MTRTAGSLLLLMCILSSFVVADDSPALSGPYLGQRPPGSYPQLFARGIVSVAENFEHSAAVFSPDGTELFWCTNVDHYRENPSDRLQRLYTMRQVHGVWTEPEIAPFTQHLEIPIQHPVFSPDGSCLYIEFWSNPSCESDTDIYVVRREGDGWTEPAGLPSAINTSSYERLHCVTSDGSIIFTRDLMTPRERMYISHRVDGEFAEPERLGLPFDSDAVELAVVVGPEDRYVLIALTRAGREDELYISYKEPDGRWTDRIRTPLRQTGGFLSLSPDGKYLFFLGEGIYWVEPSFVDDLRPDHLR